MDHSQKKKIKTLNREFAALQRQESRLMRSAVKAKPAGWKTAMEQRVPAKVYTGLNSAFCKGFSLVFQHGRKLIELTYKKENLQQKHTVRDDGFREQGQRKNIRMLHQNARSANNLNVAVTTLEGIGLGALGIGMPDIVLFLTTVLRGVYETALHYGFDYESRFEQMLILKMMAASLSTGEEWFSRNREINDWLRLDDREIAAEEFEKQIQQTSQVFAVDMLLLKFIQGLPVVGILGGVANPLYYSRVMRYVQLKYRRRYLLKLQKNM